MHYEGPQATDIDNVRALNEAFLTLLRRSSAARECLVGLREDLAKRLIALSPPQAERLAQAPFLLFSFRERDERFWRTAFEPAPNQNLFSAPHPVQQDVSRLIAAGLGFVWQLARQNPYALRLLCGATVHWCEQLSERTLIQILAFATTNRNLLVLRQERNIEIWQKLLGSGVHRQVEVRRAAQISVLQTVLTQADGASTAVWASAACRSKVPSLRVADTNDD